jgi:hypothetical protein
VSAPFVQADRRTSAPAQSTITIIECPLNFVMAKTRMRDGTVRGYDRARTFDAIEVPVDDLHNLGRILEQLSADPRKCVVRGKLVNGPKARGIRRLLHGDRKTGEAATLRPQAHWWLALDVDKLPLPPNTPPSDLEACARAATETLPAPFALANCIVQATARHGDDGNMHLRLWVWLSRPLSDAELCAWLAESPVDRSIFNPVQPIYTAAPLLEAGLADHIPQRLVSVEGMLGMSEVWVPDHLPTAHHDTGAAQYSNGANLEPPPSVDAVVRLLDDMPNPEDLDRDEWLAITMAVVGCIASLRAIGALDDDGEDRIREAWHAWSAKWPGTDPDYAEAKWSDDFSHQSPTVGWRRLLDKARRLRVDIAPYWAETIQGDFDDAPLPDDDEPGATDEPQRAKTRPVITSLPDNLHEQITKAEDALIAADYGVYRRDTMVVRVKMVERLGLKRRGIVRIQKLVEVDENHLAYLMSQAADWERWDERKRCFLPASCPLKVARTYLKIKSLGWNLPELSSTRHTCDTTARWLPGRFMTARPACCLIRAIPSSRPYPRTRPTKMHSGRCVIFTN